MNWESILDEMKWMKTQAGFVVVQLLSRVHLFVTPWTAAHQASLSFTISRSLLKLMSTESWCHPTISSSVVPFSSCLRSFPALGSFSNESALYIRWPKYWSFSFSISPFNEYSGLISFRMDWLDLLAPRYSQKSSPAPQFESINSSVLSLLYGAILSSIHHYWKNHSFDSPDLCWQCDVSAF